MGKLECKPATRGETSRRRPIGKEKSSSPASNTVTVDLDFWSVLPGHVRVDAIRTRNGKTESTVEITRGPECLKRTPEGTIEVETVPSGRRQQNEASFSKLKSVDGQPETKQYTFKDNRDGYTKRQAIVDTYRDFFPEMEFGHTLVLPLRNTGELDGSAEWTMYLLTPKAW